MLTWLDHYCRQVARLVDEKWHGGDPRKALAFQVTQRIQQAQRGILPFDGILDEALYAMLGFFIAEYIPAGGTLRFKGGMPVRPLGLLLTRQTANLLSAAKPIDMTDESWRAEIGSDRAVYVDVPHGAVLLDADAGKGDMIQLRAIFAAPFMPPDKPGHTLFIAQMTGRGSEQGRGRVAGVLTPDGGVAQFGSADTGAAAADASMKAPHAHPLLQRAVLGRVGTFLRLVLAYHCFGPEEAREPVAATPIERLRGGKPRKDESLFALTRLNASEAVGRPKGTIPASWSLSIRQEVAGHFKLQAYGPQSSLRRMIWVSPYERGPEDAPIKPRAHRL